VWKSIVSMANNIGAPLARGRLNSEQESVEENWSEFSQWDIGECWFELKHMNMNEHNEELFNVFAVVN